VKNKEWKSPFAYDFGYDCCDYYRQVKIVKSKPEEMTNNEAKHKRKYF